MYILEMSQFCYEFEKWTMITFALISASLVTGLIIILLK